MSGESELEAERAEERYLERIHKAAPGPDRLHCGTCGQWVKRVPGGQGMTWVHADSGAVVAPNPPDVSEVIHGLLTAPERYVGSKGTYADGYLDALIDALTGLGLLRPEPMYDELRRRIAPQGKAAS